MVLKLQNQTISDRLDRRITQAGGKRRNPAAVSVGTDIHLLLRADCKLLASCCRLFSVSFSFSPISQNLWIFDDLRAHNQLLEAQSTTMMLVELARYSMAEKKTY